MSTMTDTTAYQPGAVQNGYVLTEDYQWVPLPPQTSHGPTLRIYEPPVYQGAYWALIVAFLAIPLAFFPGAGIITSIGVLLFAGFAWKRIATRKMRGNGILIVTFILGFAGLGIALARGLTAIMG